MTKKINVEDILKELGSEEKNVIVKVLANISSYSQMYEDMIEYILAEYPEIDIDKINTYIVIDDDLSSHLDFGERLFIYNKLYRPFIVYLIKEKLKNEKYLKSLWIDDINTMILSMHPDIDMKIMEKFMREIEEKLKNLKYEEKWLIYNSLANIMLQDLIGDLEKS